MSGNRKRRTEGLQGLCKRALFCALTLAVCVLTGTGAHGQGAGVLAEGGPEDIGYKSKPAPPINRIDPPRYVPEELPEVEPIKWGKVVIEVPDENDLLGSTAPQKSAAQIRAEQLYAQQLEYYRQQGLIDYQLGKLEEERAKQQKLKAEQALFDRWMEKENRRLAAEKRKAEYEAAQQARLDKLLSEVARFEQAVREEEAKAAREREENGTAWYQMDLSLAKSFLERGSWDAAIKQLRNTRKEAINGKQRNDIDLLIAHCLEEQSREDQENKKHADLALIENGAQATSFVNNLMARPFYSFTGSEFDTCIVGHFFFINYDAYINGVDLGTKRYQVQSYELDYGRFEVLKRDTWPSLTEIAKEHKASAYSGGIFGPYTSAAECEGALQVVLTQLLSLERVWERDRIEFDSKFGVIPSVNSSSEMLLRDPPAIVALKERSKCLRAIRASMVPVEGGDFFMGCAAWEKDCAGDETPLHEVSVGSFMMAKYEVTQAQWVALMGNNPSMNPGCDSCPVEMVNWNQAQAFVEALNAATKGSFRLPTEAEWEFAARGGAEAQVEIFSASNQLGQHGWYKGNCDRPQPVGQKQANQLGLYDMLGNVREWCLDWYTEKAYDAHDRHDPLEETKGFVKVVRGGCHRSSAAQLRYSDRDSESPKVMFDDRNGLRLVYELH